MMKNSNDKQKGSSIRTKKTSVLLYWPNIIGYIRMVLALLGMMIAYKNNGLFVLLYSTSQALDGLDGWVARKFQQESILGAVLDQVIDRISTLYLYVLNCQVYPALAPIIVMFLTIDIGGHWIHTSGAAYGGSVSHKKIPRSWSLLRLYYRNKGVMVSSILAYECFWIGSFLLSQSENSATGQAFFAKFLIFLGTPLTIFKTITNVMQVALGVLVLSEIY